MQDPTISATEPTPASLEASDFAKRFPESDFNPHVRHYADGYVPGPRNAWVCDIGGETIREGVLVCSEPGNPRQYPQGGACAIRVYCRKHRPRHQGYELDLKEFRNVPAAFDSLRQLLGKVWFGGDAARLLCDRFLRGLHVAPATR